MGIRGNVDSNNLIMPQITYITPDGEKLTHDVPEGDSVMEGAVQNGVDGIVAECGGNCQCATCHVYVEVGLDRLQPIADDEEAMLETTVSDRKSNSRLSCQLKVTAKLDGLVVQTPPAQ